MSLKIGQTLFTGPFALADTVLRANHPRAVYAVLVKEGPGWDPCFRLIEIGVSPPEGVDFPNHPHRPAWDKASDGKAVVYLHSLEDASQDLERIAEDIQRQYGSSGGIVTLSNGV
jgi:hypothetical protein